MKKVWEINLQAFEKMLDWLNKDREIAGQKYEEIRFRLIKILHYRGCFEGEELADEIFDRVAQKIDSLAKTYQGDPAHYFLNVANKVYLEYRRKPVSVEFPANLAAQSADFATEEDFQPEHKCLKNCLANLSAAKRKFIISYYQKDKKAKIISHQRLAQSIGIELTSLHARAFRLRAILQKCVLKCLAENE